MRVFLQESSVTLQMQCFPGLCHHCSMGPPKSVVPAGEQDRMDDDGSQEEERAAGGSREAIKRPPTELFKMGVGSRIPCLLATGFPKALLLLKSPALLGWG